MQINRKSAIAGFILGSGLFLTGCENRDKQSTGVATTQPATGGQTVCPVTGEKIDPAVFVMHEGKKIYFCCDSCIKPFQKDPKKYLTRLPQFGGKEEPGKGEGMPMDGK